MPPRLRIGLTGGIASGKSTVEQRFIELGVPVINADDSSRAVVASRASRASRRWLRASVPGFSPAHGELDRRALRSLIFSDPARRKELEAILHPLIRADMEQRSSQAGGPYVVQSIPLLVESNARDRRGTAFSWWMRMSRCSSRA